MLAVAPQGLRTDEKLQTVRVVSNVMYEYKKMKRWARRLWVGALESGKYNMKGGALHQVDEDGKVFHDALGILCEKMPKCYLQLPRNKNEKSRYYYRGSQKVSYDDNIEKFAADVDTSYIPDMLAEEIGLSNQAQFAIANLVDGGADVRKVVKWIIHNL